MPQNCSCRSSASYAPYWVSPKCDLSSWKQADVRAFVTLQSTSDWAKLNSDNVCCFYGNSSGAELAISPLGYNSGYVTCIINWEGFDVKNYCLKKLYSHVAYQQILLSGLNKRPIHGMPIEIVCYLFITHISCYHLYRYLRIQYLSSLKPLRSYEKVT